MKNVILLICFLLYARMGFSQINMLSDSMSYYYKHDNYPRAIYYGKLKVEYCIKQYGKNHANHGVALSDLGLIYSAMHNYSEAERLYKEAIYIYKKTIGETHANYLEVKKNLGNVYSHTNRYSEAETILKEVSGLYKKTQGEESISYAVSLTELGELYNEMSRFNEAESMYKSALEIYSIKSGEQDGEYITHLNNLGMVYYQKGDYKSAEPIFERAIELIKKTGETSNSYAAVLGNLASVYKKFGRYYEAESLEKKEIELSKKIYGENSYQYHISLNNLAHLYQLQGNLKDAETFFQKSMEIVVKTEGKSGKSYADCLANMGEVYNKGGNYEKALTFFKEASALHKKIGGEETVDFAMSLNNLGAAYASTGNYALVEPLYLRALSILKKVVGEKHPDYGVTLNNLATYYSLVDNTELSVFYSKKTLELKKQLGENSPDYALSLINLAAAQRDLGNYKATDSLYAKALVIYLKVYGKEHPMTASLFSLVANYYKSIGSYKISEELYKKALAIQKKSLGENHPDYALTLSNYGTLCLLTGNFDAAETNFKEALKIYRNQKNFNSNFYSITLDNLAGVYLITRKFTQANELFIETIQSQKKQLIDKLNFLSESELLSYLKENEKMLLHSFTSLFYNPSETLLSAVYNNQLFLKGVSIQNLTSLNKFIEQSKDASLITLWKNYLDNKKVLNQQLTVAVSQRFLNTDSLTNLCDQQEKSLLRQSSTFRNVKEQLNINWKDVKESLQPGEATVEFVRFNYSHRFFSDSVFYAAIMLKPGVENPSIIQLFEEKSLKLLLMEAAEKNLPTLTYSKLYQLIWKPISSQLNGIHKVYFAADGLLHKISFAALQVSEDSFLADYYQLEQVNSTREVAIKRNETQTESPIVLFGGADYEQQEIILSTNATSYPHFVSQNRSGSLSSFSYLPGTLIEVEHIKQTLESQHKKVYCYTGKAATEAAFRMQSNNAPAVIHIATHGFSLPDIAPVKQQSANSGISKNGIKISNNPLLRCGLILAGGNKGWNAIAKQNEDDGILTALEISAQNFTNTHLVVLSACETGLGEIKGSEGVFGLERAFKIAGASYIMAALWKVPDEPTEQFMTTFYQYWMSGKKIQQAFWQAQEAMRKGGFTTNDWAAFTLIH